MAHTHEHHHTISSINSIFVVCIIINALFVVVEAGIGFFYNSLGLLSDAGHNLSDVFSLLLSLLAFRISGHPISLYVWIQKKHDSCIAHKRNYSIGCRRRYFHRKHLQVETAGTGIG